jgi:hypothetical protein
MTIATHVRDYLIDLAALDQLSACAENHPDSPIYELIRQYVKFSMKAIALRRDIRGDIICGKLATGTKQYDQRYQNEVLPLVIKLDKITAKIHAMCDEYDNPDDLSLDADWWKKGNNDQRDEGE